jgi:hypothetical protein
LDAGGYVAGFTSPRDALIAMMDTSMSRTPDSDVVRIIIELVETRGYTVAQYVTDTLPRIQRLKRPPGEGFFMSQAKKFGTARPLAAPQQRQDEKPCGCNGTGRIGSEYCTCAMGRDLRRTERRKPKPEA